MSTELVKSEDVNLETMKRADLPVIWGEFRTKVEALKKTAETLTVTSVDDKEGMKLARVTRLALKNARVDIDAKRKELGEEALRRKQKIDSDAKELRDIIEPLEERLLEQEKFAERAEETRKVELKASREKELALFGADTQFVNLSEMPEEQYETFYNNAQAGYRSKLAAEKKAEEDRIAKEKADAEERERIRVENERLKKEAAERDEKARKDRVAAEAERVRLELENAEKARIAKEAADKEADRIRAEAAKAAEVARKEKEAIEAKAATERAAAKKREDAAAAKSKAEKDAADAKAKTEREAREKLEAEIAAKKAKEDADKKATEAATKKAARAPDKQKVIAFASVVMKLETPDLTTPEGKAIAGEINDRIDAFAQWLNEKAGAL